MIPLERRDAAVACWLKPSDLGKMPHGGMDFRECKLWPLSKDLPQPNTTVYISGPVTDVPEGNRPLFMLAQRMLLSAGCSVFNPSHIDYPIDPLEGDALWSYFMSFCVRALPECDSILMLPDWQNSKGAKWEHRIAKDVLGLSVFYCPVLSDEGEKP
jgi:Domain of unknown function (DUF4406)